MKKITLIFGLLVTLILLIGCQETPDQIRHDDIFQSIEIGYSENDTINNVNSNLNLPVDSNFPNRVLLVWESSNPNVLSNQGIVTRPEQDTQVILTLYVTIDGKTRTNIFIITVKGLGIKHQITWIIEDEQNVFLVDDQTTLNQPENPTKEGYFFMGWYYQGSLFDFDTVIDQDYELIATFELIQEVSYDVEIFEQRVINNTYEKKATYTFTGTVGDLVNYQVEKEGFTLNEERSILSGTLFNAPKLVLRVFYDRNFNDVTYIYNETILTTINQKYGSDLELIEAPQIDYYQFDGWFLDEAFTLIAHDEMFVTGDVTLYAKYTEITEGTYQVNIYEEDLMSQDYNLLSENFFIGTYLTQITFDDIPYGFEINEDLSTTEGLLTIQEPLVLVIYLDRLTYEVTYQVEEDLSFVDSYKYGQEIIWIEDPTKPYHIFDNWYLDSEFDEIAPSNIVINTHIILYAKFIEVTSGSYTVYIYRQNIANDNYTLYNELDIVDDYNKNVSYTASVHGFFINEELSTLEGWHDFEPQLELFIYYDRQLYDVTFIDDAIIYETQVKYLGVIEQIDDPDKDGFEFLGWKLLDDSVQFYQFSQPVTNHITLKAVWKDLSGPVYEGYYVTLNGLADYQVRNQLNAIISVMTKLTYDAAKTILPISDVDPNNSNRIILIYNRASVVNTWDPNNIWNREHVWPQSLLGVDTSSSSRHEGSDVHNLKPANPSINSTRGNFPFVDGSGTHFKIGSGYWPGELDKGDIARILFYMDVRYTHLSLVDNYPEKYEMAYLQTLLKWHIEDPVDDFERNRNNVIYSYQQNRNPFIDHPELVERIYGSITLSNGSSLTLSLPSSKGIFMS